MFKYLFILFCFSLFLFAIPGSASCESIELAQDVGIFAVVNPLEYNMLEFTTQANVSELNFNIYNGKMVNFSDYGSMGISVLKCPLEPG